MNPDETLVAVVPPVPGLGQNRIFERVRFEHFGDATHWMEPFWELGESANAAGFELRTWDTLDLRDAAALLIMDVSLSPREVGALRGQHPHLKIVQQILESCLGRAWVFDPKNHRSFDAILTYNDHLKRLPGYFVFKIPAGGLKFGKRGKAFAVRNLACMVANVPNPAPWLPRRFGFGMMRQGWSFSPQTWWNYAREGGSLYRQRLSVAACFARSAPGDFEIFGPHWDLIDDLAIRRAWKGTWSGSKLDLLGDYRFTLAYENCRNDFGYISEKIFDAMLGGTVPVYLGNERIGELIPPESFVDARKFAGPEELFAFLDAMKEPEWSRMRMSGDEFLRNGAEERFGAKQYCDAVLSSISYALARPVVGHDKTAEGV